MHSERASNLASFFAGGRDSEAARRRGCAGQCRCAQRRSRPRVVGEAREGADPGSRTERSTGLSRLWTISASRWTIWSTTEGWPRLRGRTLTDQASEIVRRITQSGAMAW